MTLLSAGARGSKATKGETIEKLPPMLFDQNPENTILSKPIMFYLKIPFDQTNLFTKDEDQEWFYC